MERHEQVGQASKSKPSNQGHRAGDGMSYLRFGAMIATSMVFMYAVMYLHTFEVGSCQVE